MLTSGVLLALVALWSVCFARPGREHSRSPLTKVLEARQTNGSTASSLQVDLGYGIYEGYLNSTTNLNNWRGYESSTGCSL